MAFFNRSQTRNFRSLSPDEAAFLLQEQARIAILDVRNPDEFHSSTGRIQNAILIPVDELSSRVSELSGLKDKTILVYCRSGRRSKRACEILSKQGFTVVNLEGGILRWLGESHSVVRTT